ncbi:NlpC/P60 family protein [Garicola koreensis]|uniref:Cell wall-associated NlpC family hydrolase n=1 Tax=Garicola koreensis TaxID=1262554 RepID=A0A7W5XPR5_9MICC|nr:cell wall-associated NlpC family hydrolase [Garicola koreensis]
MKHRRNLAVAAATALVVTTALVGTTLPDLVADRTSDAAAEQADQDQSVSDTFVVTELPDTPSAKEVSTAKESDQAREKLMADIVGRIDQASDRANEFESELHRQQSLATAQMDEAEEAAEAAEEAEQEAEAAMAMDASSEYQEGDTSAADVLLGEDDAMAEDATDQQLDEQAEQDAIDAEQAAREAEAERERAEQLAAEAEEQAENVGNELDWDELGENIQQNLEAMYELEGWDVDFDEFLENVLGNDDFFGEDGEIDNQELVYRVSQLRADAEQAEVSDDDAEEADQEEADESEQISMASADVDGEAASAEEPETPGFDALTDEQQELLSRGAEAEEVDDARAYYGVVLENDGLLQDSAQVNWNEVEAHVVRLESQAEQQESEQEQEAEEPAETPSPSATPTESATAAPSPSANASTSSAEQSEAVGFDSLSSDQQELLAETGELEGISSARDYYRVVLENTDLTTSEGAANWTALESHQSYLQAQEEEEAAAEEAAAEQAAAEEAAAEQAAAEQAAAEQAAAEEAAAEEAAAEQAAAEQAAAEEAAAEQAAAEQAAAEEAAAEQAAAEQAAAEEAAAASIPSWGELSSSQQEMLNTGARLESGFSGSGGDYYRAVLNNPDLTTADGRVSQNALQWHVDYLERQDRASSTPSPSRTQSASPTPTPTPTQTSTPTPTATQTQSSNVQAASSGGGNAAQIAMNWAVNTANRSNTYYRLGANGPDAWDCSSFTQAAYAQAGISLGRTTYDQITQGRQVSWDERQPGDLIFWGDYHMAIYLGNGQIVDAGSPSSGVSVRSVFGSPTSVRRVG